MRLLPIAALAITLIILSSESYAYITVSYLNTTVLLGTNATARVVEVISLNMTNASIATYQQDRKALGLTLSDWQLVLNNELLGVHIMNPRSSTYGLLLLPSEPVSDYNGVYTAYLTLEYYANNVTRVSRTSPRTFKYTLNSSVFNFENTAAGGALYPNSTLNLIIPAGSTVASMSPLPDYPPAAYVNSYKNTTRFSWNQEEPLGKFSFSYSITESPQREVLDFFANIWDNYRAELYLAVAAIVIAVIVYFYLRPGNGKGD